MTRRHNDKYSHICREYVEKYSLNGKLTIPKKTLARIIVSEYPELVDGDDLEKKIEMIRVRLRYVTGSSGTVLRKKIPQEDVQLSTQQDGVNMYLDFIQDSDNVEIDSYKITGCKDIVIINDLHIPFYDQHATKACLDFTFEKKPDMVYLNGDILDCYNQSKFQPDVRRRNTRDEMNAGRQFLALLRHKLPNTRIVYKFGNHEKRWEDFLKSNAPQLLGMEEFELRYILRFNDWNIDYVPQNQIAKAGHLNIMHGHELGKTFGIPANPSRWLYTKVKSNAAIGHLHATSHHSEGSLDRSQHSCFTIGCLAGLQPEYFPTAYTKWNHGFAHVEMDGDNFLFNNYRIINGKLFR